MSTGRPAPRRPRTHPYQPDPGTHAIRRAGGRLCICGLPRTNRIHDLPDRADAADLDRRRLGEHDRED